MAQRSLKNSESTTKSANLYERNQARMKGRLYFGSVGVVIVTFALSPSQALSSIATPKRFCKAQSLVESLVVESNCYSSPAGAVDFADACAINVVYEDRCEPQPILGQAVRSSVGKE
jgi:hypothetical protein